jgi:hypothetical protein
MDDGGMRKWRPVAAALLVNVVVPLGLFYGLRAAGVGAIPALLVGAVAPGLRTVHSVVRERRIDALGVLVLAMIAVSVLMATLTGDPRALLARDSWGTGFIGLWVLGSLLTRRPAILALGAEVVPADKAREMLDRWAVEERFRRNVIMVSALWGGAFLLDAVLRVGMAFTLPVDAVPGLSTALTIGLLVVAAVISRRMVRAMVRPRADG